MNVCRIGPITADNVPYLTEVAGHPNSLPCFVQIFEQSVYLCMYLKYCWMSGKQCRPRSDAATCGVWSGSIQFAQTFLSENLDYVGYSLPGLHMARSYWATDRLDPQQLNISRRYLQINLNLYHSLGKFNRRQIDDIFFFFTFFPVNRHDISWKLFSEWQFARNVKICFRGEKENIF